VPPGPIDPADVERKKVALGAVYFEFAAAMDQAEKSGDQGAAADAEKAFLAKVELYVKAGAKASRDSLGGLAEEDEAAEAGTEASGAATAPAPTLTPVSGLPDVSPDRRADAEQLFKAGPGAMVYPAGDVAARLGAQEAWSSSPACRSRPWRNGSASS